MENSIEALQNAIKSIKMAEERRGNKVTEEDIAKQLSISKEQLNEYVTGNLPIPDGLVTKLLSFYGIKLKMVEDRIKMDIYIPPDEEAQEKQE